MRNTETQEKTGAEMAADYAAGIVGELETLALLVDNWEALTDYVYALDVADHAPDGDDAETLSDYADALDLACGGPHALAEVLALYRELGGDDAREAAVAWADNVLDVEITGRHTGNGWEVTEVAFLVASGGPTARVVWDGSSTLAVRCSWSSEEIVRRVECDALLNYADALADTVGS